MVANEKWFSGAGATAGFYSHQINFSARFDDGSSSYLSRTNSGTATNEDVGLLSFWYKRGNNIGSTTNESIAGASTPQHRIEFNTNNPSGYSDAIVFVFNNASSIYTTQGRYRDPTGWTNFIMEYNSDDSTASNRIKLYINGVQLGAFSDSSVWSSNGGNTEASGRDFGFTANGSTVNFGRNPNNTSSYYDGYIAEIICVDGSASYTDVGESKQGIWIPKEYTGSFGNNGFHLKFADASNIGLDSSGNSNNFSVNGMNADHIVLDSPTFS